MLEIPYLTWALATAAGFMVVMLVDIAWWHIDHKKAEKGLEAHEHYHITLELFIVAVIIHYFVNIPELVIFLIAAGLMFFKAEWAQSVEPRATGDEVKQGHPFAIGSGHFKSSAIIGFILFGILIITTTITIFI